jgi:hypothetical protein
MGMRSNHGLAEENASLDRQSESIDIDTTVVETGTYPNRIIPVVPRRIAFNR